MHFTYKISNNNIIIGFISPVNESIFEHLKLSTTPILLWWIVFYILNNKKLSLNINTWLLGSISSVIISAITIIFIYYFSVYAIGINSIILDIISLYIGILFGQYIGMYIYKIPKDINIYLISSVLILLIIINIYLTLNPPKIPFFKDKNNNTYGIFNLQK